MFINALPVFFGMKYGFDGMKYGFDGMKYGFDGMKYGFSGMKYGFDGMKYGFFGKKNSLSTAYPQLIHRKYFNQKVKFNFMKSTKSAVKDNQRM